MSSAGTAPTEAAAADPPGRLEAVIECARAALADGRPEEAGAELFAALEELRGLQGSEFDVLRARTHGLLGLVAFEADGVTGALAHLDDAGVAATRSGDRSIIAITWSQRANILGRSGDLPGALDALDRAADHLDAMPARGQTILHLNRGVARSQAGLLDAAIDDLTVAARLAGEHSLPREQFMATHNLGYVHHLRGDAPAALAAMEAADALDVDVSRGVSLLDRGRVLLEAGLADEAVAVLEQAIEVCLDDEQHHVADEARYERARAALLRGNHSLARAFAAGAADGFTAREATTWAERCQLFDLRVRLLQLPTITAPAATDDERGRAARIAGDAEDLAGRLDAAGNAVTARAAQVLAAEAAAVAGDVERAVRLLPAAQPDGLPRLTLRLADRLARARVALAADRGDEARAEVRAAAGDLRRAAATATTLDLRTSAAVHAGRLASLDLHLSTHDPLMTLLAVERWRAPGSRHGAVRPAVDETTRALLRTRRQLLEQLRDGPEADDEAWRELASIEERIAASHRTAGRDAGAAVPDGSTHVALLTALAADHRDLVTTLVRGDEVLVLTLAGGHCRAHSAGSADELGTLARRVRGDLRTLATHVDDALAAVARNSLDATVTELRERLLGPADLDPGRRLLVVTHAQLAGLPWGVIARDHPVVVAASATAWALAHGRRQRTIGAGTVAVLPGPRLAAAAEEVAAVASAWGTTPPAVPARGEDLVAALRDATVVHVAAHGRHHREQPLFSSLELLDGLWCLYDVEATGVGSTQVVLASCEAGDASVRSGDEPLGLASGLLSLGATSVVAPVCPVPDDRLPAVMGRLHHLLATGTPTDEALLVATADDEIARAAFLVIGAAAHVGR